jgi:hypothetical protein
MGIHAGFASFPPDRRPRPGFLFHPRVSADLTEFVIVCPITFRIRPFWCERRVADRVAAYTLSRSRFQARGSVALWILVMRMAPSIASTIPFFLAYRYLGSDTISRPAEPRSFCRC